MLSARMKKPAAGYRVNDCVAFPDATQSSFQVPTFQFGSLAQFKPTPSPDHPAPDQLFATVAALQHLCDEHDMDHVSPPPIWPMILHGAMSDPFGGDDDAAAALCLDTIVHGNDVTIRLAIRGAVRILESMCQRYCYLPFVLRSCGPSAHDAARVCMRALEIGEDSVDMMCSTIRLIGLLCRTVRWRQLDKCCTALIITVGRTEDQRIHNTCTAAIFNAYWSLANADSDMPLLDELRGC
jgi:hypothetical protein